MKAGMKALTLRFPASLLEQMKALAKRHNRSLNGEIITALEEYSKKTAEGQIGGSNRQTGTTEEEAEKPSSAQ